MGLMDRALDKGLDRAMEKMDSRFGELQGILREILTELRVMNGKLGPVSGTGGTGMETGIEAGNDPLTP